MPPKPRKDRKVRITLTIAAIVAFIWLIFFVGNIFSHSRSMETEKQVYPNSGEGIDARQQNAQGQ